MQKKDRPPNLARRSEPFAKRPSADDWVVPESPVLGARKPVTGGLEDKIKGKVLSRLSVLKEILAPPFGSPPIHIAYRTTLVHWVAHGLPIDQLILIREMQQDPSLRNNVEIVYCAMQQILKRPAAQNVILASNCTEFSS